MLIEKRKRKQPRSLVPQFLQRFYLKTKALSVISILFSIILMDSSFSLHIICAITILGTLLFMLVNKNCRSSPQKKTATSPPPSDSSQSNWGHHVFSSFSSVDVPISFLNRIWKELRRKGFDPFTDNEIERSVLIGPELIKAISVSRIVIVILSRNYASSSRCLDELVEIIKCKEVLCLRVVTVFYELDPLDVEKQTGGFGKIFRKTCKRKTKEDIARWSQALAEVATIDGYHSSNWLVVLLIPLAIFFFFIFLALTNCDFRHYEAAMIENIATDISDFLNNSTQSSDLQGLVGMEAHMELSERMDEYLAKVVRQERIITNQDLKACGIRENLLHCHFFDLLIF